MPTYQYTRKDSTHDFDVHKIGNFLSCASKLIIRLFLVLILVVFGILLILITSSNFPGAQILRRTINGDRSDGRVDHWEVISWEPRAVIYHNFLSQDEIEHLINIAKPHMEKSTGFDRITGKIVPNNVRTCSETFLKRGHDEAVRAIEKRIADFTVLPIEHGEGLQVRHYEVGQKYMPHYDSSLQDDNTKNGGQTMATVLMYLSDVEEGGQTVFPYANRNFSIHWSSKPSECGKRGLSVTPKMGDALFFWSLKPDATIEYLSLHGGCPVIKGNKWSATSRIHIKEYSI